MRSTLVRVASLLGVLLIAYLLFINVFDDNANLVSDDSTLPTIRVGVLVSGSVHWQIETLKNYKFDTQAGFNVIPVPLGSVNALLVALQGDAVDTIVSDWVWVANQRNKERHFFYHPFSTALGGVVAPIEQNINSVSDLVGKSIGVAGGPEGKSWLLLTALARQKYKIDLAQQSSIKFVAPPLVNALLTGKKLDAGLNYWHFNSVLDKSLYKEVLSGQDILSAFGVSDKVPMIGWVIKQDWAEQNREMVDKFLAAVSLAGQRLKDSDEAWGDIEYLLKPQQKQHSVVLRDAFRRGIPQEFTESDVENIKLIFAILEKSKGYGNQSNSDQGKALAELPQDIFWQVKGR